MLNIQLSPVKRERRIEKREYLQKRITINVSLATATAAAAKNDAMDQRLTKLRFSSQFHI